MHVADLDKGKWYLAVVDGVNLDIVRIEATEGQEVTVSRWWPHTGRTDLVLAPKDIEHRVNPTDNFLDLVGRIEAGQL